MDDDFTRRGVLVSDLLSGDGPEIPAELPTEMIPVPADWEPGGREFLGYGWWHHQEHTLDQLPDAERTERIERSGAIFTPEMFVIDDLPDDGHARDRVRDQAMAVWFAAEAASRRLATPGPVHISDASLDRMFDALRQIANDPITEALFPTERVFPRDASRDA